jgi:hypothetical protein
MHRAVVCRDTSVNQRQGLDHAHLLQYSRHDLSANRREGATMPMPVATVRLSEGAGLDAVNFSEIPLTAVADVALVAKLTDPAYEESAPGRLQALLKRHHET